MCAMCKYHVVDSYTCPKKWLNTFPKKEQKNKSPSQCIQSIAAAVSAPGSNGIQLCFGM